MAKVKLVQFDLLSLLNESKRVVDFIQRVGKAQLIDVDNSELMKYDTSSIVNQYERKYERAASAVAVLEKYCNIKISLLQSFRDYKEIEYSEYKLLCDKVDKISAVCEKLLDLNRHIEKLNDEIAVEKTNLNYHSYWLGLDIPMASKRTLTTNIFIGSFRKSISAVEIAEKIRQYNEALDAVAVEVVKQDKMLTCAVVMCHHTDAEETLRALKAIGFIEPDKVEASTPEKSTQTISERISMLENELESTKKSIVDLRDEYDNLRFLCDFYSVQQEKYNEVAKTASTQQVFVVSGFIPERISEEIKFAVEQKFICQMQLKEPDYSDENVPVFIENGFFASGVESITDMYSSPSNKDIDPNPIMAFFYYIFFGFMLSDAGYGILMIIFSLVAGKKLKLKGNSQKFTNMVFFCGISTVFWGAMFGGWFGDLIPTIATNFLGYETPPDLAIWMDPVSNSMTLLLFCLGFGIVQLFAGLIIRGYMLIKEKHYIAAVCDTVPVMIFVSGFAIIGAGLITELPEAVSGAGAPLMAVGAVLIVLTAGRSAKNIIGKLGGGLYSLYNITTGYMSDILSYSRLLALSLVTGVVASAVNLLASMLGNIFLFVPIFILGHTLNIAINLIGTYVHTNRLQYVEFFSKFYEGSGKVFTPFRINSKHYTIKEEKNYE